MIVYFADRQLNVLGTASTELPYGIVIVADEKNESLETGTKTFNVTFVYDDSTRELITTNVAVGNFLLRSADDENEFYTIVQTEHNTKDQTVQAYCEDAGLDLLNTIAPTLTNTTTHTVDWYVNTYLPAGWEINVNELSGSQILSWDGESTVTERLLSIVNSFNGELGFSYEIEGLNVTKRYVNLYQHRGNSTAVHQLRLGYDISSITTNKTIEELATAFTVTGGTLKGKSTPITLTDNSYSSDGTTTHAPAQPSDDYQIVNKQVRCISAMQKWSSALDSDGLLLRQYSYDTTDAQTLFSHAVAELKKVINETITYNLEFVEFPDDAKLGDQIYVVDDTNNLYLEGRILSLTKSAVADQTTATLGDFVVKTSGISDRLAQLAESLRQEVLSATTVTVSSSNGIIFNNTAISTTLTATVYYAEEAITTQTRLEEIFGAGVAVNWYSGGVLVGTGFSYAVSSANDTENYVVKVED